MERSESAAYELPRAMVIAEDRDRAPRDPARVFIRSVIVLSAVSFSLTYFLLTLRLGKRVLGLVSENALDPRARMRILAWSLAVPALVAVIAVIDAKRRGPGAIARTAALSRAVLPLLGVGVLPALLRPGASDGREIAFLALVGLVALTFERTILMAVPLPPTLGAALAWIWRCPAKLWDAAAALAVAAYVSLSSFASIRLHDKMLTSNFDLGLFENLFFNTLQGHHGLAVGRKYFGEHAEFMLYPLLPIYALFPRTETLLILQSVLLGGAAIPLYLLARRWLTSGQAFVVVLLYLLCPAVHGPNFYDFHFLTLSGFFIAWAAFFFFTRRWIAFWMFVLFALSCREDVALGGAAIGLGVAVHGRWRRVGLALTTLSLAWFVVVKFVWMARFGDQAFAGYYSQLIPPGESGFVGVLKTAISNPVLVLFSVLTEAKLLLALHLLTPLAFLPVRQWKTGFLLLPGFIVLGLSTNRDAVLQIHFHYVCHFVPYLFVAFVIGLAVRPRARRYALLAAAAVSTLICTAQFGALFREKYKASYHDVSFDWTAEDDANLGDLESLIAEIPARASVSTGEYEGPHLARRRYLYSVKDGPNQADFVLFGMRSLRWGGTQSILDAMGNGTYGVRARHGQFVLLERNYSIAENAKTSVWIKEHPPG